jgi:hypothetical protein
LPSSAQAAVAGFANELHGRLSNHSVGFQFTVSDKYNFIAERAEVWRGWGRTCLHG